MNKANIPIGIAQATVPDTVLSSAMRAVLMCWSARYGDCYECGLPAAFKTGIYLMHPPPADVPPEDKRCAVCAANDACDGETISRIDQKETP